MKLSDLEDIFYSYFKFFFTILSMLRPAEMVQYIVYYIHDTVYYIQDTVYYIQDTVYILYSVYSV